MPLQFKNFESSLFTGRSLEDLKALWQAMLEKHHVHLTNQLYDKVLGRDTSNDYFLLEAVVLLKEIGLREYEKQLEDKKDGN